MTRYALDKVLWNYARQPEYKVRFDSDVEAAIDGHELSEAERQALTSRDLRAMFLLGAHPFLLYSFAITLNGGWSRELMKDYVARLDGLELGDIET